MNVGPAGITTDTRSAAALRMTEAWETYTPLAGIQPSALADEVSVVHNAGAAVQAGVGGVVVTHL